jgi:hypothetical protein
MMVGCPGWLTLGGAFSILYSLLSGGEADFFQQRLPIIDALSLRQDCLLPAANELGDHPSLELENIKRYLLGC